MELAANKGRQEKVVTVRTPNWRSESRFVVGADIGQSADCTALCIIELYGTRLDGSSPLENHFDVRFLMRLPLGTPYPQIVVETGMLMSRPPLDGADVELIVDQSGVGAPVVDLFTQAGLKPIGVVITGGHEENQIGSRKFTVPKAVLVSLLDAKLNTGELRIARELRESSALENELRDFRRLVTQSGNYSFGARSSSHDDLVLACGLALWGASRRKPSWRSPQAKPKVILGHEEMRKRFAR